jgi:anti-sigma factor RsiW
MTAYQMTPRDDLHWLAFCYVAGELSAAEASAFEARLATDESACEAVTLAMRTCGALALACDDTASRTIDPICRPAPIAAADGLRTRWSNAAVTAITGTAVTAACVAWLLGLFGPTEEQVARRDGTERLVAAWVHGEAVRNGLDDDAEALDVADADLDPPDWMLAAVTADELTKRVPGAPLDDVQEN